MSEPAQLYPGTEKLTPAQILEGLTLENGWVVGSRIPRPNYSTGGFFSQGYVVSHPDGRKGFLKALDYFAAFQGIAPSTILYAMTKAFLFESEICEFCAKRAMSRVVRAIDKGRIVPRAEEPTGVVEYLIFELADGDVRSHLSLTQTFDAAGALRALHHTCTGLFQLHGSMESILFLEK